MKPIINGGEKIVGTLLLSRSGKTKDVHGKKIEGMERVRPGCRHGSVITIKKIIVSPV